MKIYDGTSDKDPLIGTYCGQHRNLMIYSSSENLFVQFTTLQRTADSQNRGFSGWFEFSERFVNLGMKYHLNLYFIFYILYFNVFIFLIFIFFLRLLFFHLLFLFLLFLYSLYDLTIDFVIEYDY